MDFSLATYFTDKRCYFAAANGYGGFRSYFKVFFSPEDHTHLFILKGGPGTGKSRLFESVGAVFASRGCLVEWIFCSSDPTSLDGVRIRENGKGVALVDGTAPHVQDPLLPGAADTLINLGEGWDEAALIARRPDIETLNGSKRLAYKKTYEYLSISSKYDEKFMAEIKSQVNEGALKQAACAFVDTLTEARRGEVLCRPVSAFCRFGHVHLPTYETQGTRVLLPSGDPALRSLFLGAVLDEVKARGIACHRSPSPFSDEKTDALLFPEDGVALLAYAPQSEDGTAPLASGLETVTPSQTARLYESIREELLKRAQRELSYAAEAHADLEHIYTAAMDFSQNNRLTDTLVRRIDRILYGTV